MNVVDTNEHFVQFKHCRSGQGESPFVCTLIVYFTGKHGAKGDDCEGWSLRS